MARSRPKLSQSPWSGLDAVRKIMDRFGEFGESLNRMAGALHGLEDSMKHLLGVTSRVTAAMLMLHGSLAYAGKPKNGNSKSSNDDQEVWDKRKADNIAEKAENKKINEAENIERKKKIRQEKDQNAKIDRLYKERLRLENLSKFGKSSKQTGLETFQKDSRREFNIKRSQATTFFEKQKLDPKLLTDPKLIQQQANLKKLQDDSFTEALTPDPTTKIAPGPTDKDIARWVLDTEYSYASTQKTPEKANADLGELSKKDQDTRQQVTQLSLIGVNKLGQVLESLSLEIEPVLRSKETLFNAGNATQAEHDIWKANEAKKTNRVSMADAEAQLKAFATSKGVTQALINEDINAPKLNAKNFVGAEGQVLGSNNPFNKGLGSALGLPQMAEGNKRQGIVDPLFLAMNDILKKIRTLKFNDLPAIATGFGLDISALEKAHQQTSGGASQAEIAKLFKMNFGGKGAHDADSDTEMYAKLMPLVGSMSRIVMQSIDTRDLKAYLEEIGFGESEEANLEQIKEKEYKDLPHVKAKDKTMSDVDTEASRLATEETLYRKYENTPIDIPEGPRTNVSPFSRDSGGTWKQQPTITVDNQEVLSQATNPTATPQDYISKLKELKALNATGLSGDTSEFDQAIDALNAATKLTPLDPNAEYSGFKNDTLTSTPKTHQSRVEVSPFETTGMGSFVKRPNLSVDRLPGLSGTHTDDISYTEEMVSKIDELLASDATLMNGTTDQLKSIQDILKAALVELKAYKGVPAPVPPGVPIVSNPPTPVPPTPPPPPPIPFLPKSLKDVGAQIKEFGSRLAKIGPALMNKLKEVDFTKVMGGGMENAKEAFSTLAKGIFITATALSGAVMGLSQLANPDVFATFQNSLVLLGMSVGSAFMVPMLKLSWYIQQIARDFLDMSPEVRKNLEGLAELAIYVVGASLAFKAIAFIVSPILLVTKGLWALTVAIGATIAAMGKNGIVNTIGNGIAGFMGGGAKDAMGLGGSWMGAGLSNTLKFAGVVAKTTAIVAGVSEAFLGLIDIIFQTKYSMTSRLLQGMVDKQNEATETAIEDSDRRPKTEEEKNKALKNFDENKEFAKQKLDMTPEVANLFNKKIQEGYAKASAWDNDLNKTNHPLHEMLGTAAVEKGVPQAEQEVYAKRYNQAEQLLQKNKKEGNEKGVDTNRIEMASILSELSARGQKLKPWLTTLTNDTKPIEGTDKLKDYASGQLMKPGFSNQNQTLKNSKETAKQKAEKDFESGGGMKGLLMSLQSFRSQPSYMGVEEAHRRVQVEALKSDPLEQLLNEVRSNELLKMVRSLAELEKTSGKTQESSILQFSKWVLGAGH